MAPRSSHVLVALLLSVLAYACGEAPTKPPVVAATVGAAPTAASGLATPRALRRRVCKLGLTRREAGRDVSGESELTIGEDAAGDAVELRLAARDHELTLERSYDSVHRFLSERRRMRSPNEDWRTTFTWQRDAKGQVVQAERAEENLGPQGTRRPLHVVSVVLERNAKGGWLRRESRDPDVVFRREMREYDGEGRVTLHRSETNATPTAPARTVRTLFTYVSIGSRARKEVVEVLVPGEAPRLERETSYDDRGLAMLVHGWVKDEIDEGAWVIERDAAGRMLTRTRGDGVKETYTYSGDCPLDIDALVAQPNSATE